MSVPKGQHSDAPPLACSARVSIGPCAAPDCTVDLPPVTGHSKITVTVTLTASPTASSGSITVTVFGKSVTTQLVVTPLPAALDLLNPQITKSPVAGGTGAFTVTVTEHRRPTLRRR